MSYSHWTSGPDEDADFSGSVVAMVSMAFGILGLGACLCCKDVDAKMTNKVREPPFAFEVVCAVD